MLLLWHSPKCRTAILNCGTVSHLIKFLPLYRTLLLSHGIEKIVRRAKVNHETCKDAATDALRDLGLDNYNS